MLPGVKVKRWTPADIEYLRGNFEKYTDSEMANVLGRSPEAVQTKRNELGFIKPASFSLERSIQTQFKKGHESVIVPHHLKKKRADAWSDDEVSYLKANWEYKTSLEIAMALGRTRSGTTSKALELGIKKSEAATKEIRRRLIGKIVRKDGWTAEQLKYVKENWATQSAAEIAEVIGRSAASIKTKANKSGLKTSLATKKRLAKVSNAGNFKPVGGVGTITTRTTKAGAKTVWIKVADNTWQQLSRFNWLQAGNSIPDDHVIGFIDGDSTNCDLENLQLRKKGRHMQHDAIEMKEKRRAARKADKEQKKLDVIQSKLRLKANRILENERKELNRKNEARLAKEAKTAFRSAKRTVDKLIKANAPVLRKAVRMVPANERLQIKQADRERKKAALLEERQKALLLKQEQVRSARAEKERQRLTAKQEEKKILPTRVIDYSELIPLRIDHKTVVMIKPHQDPEKILAKYGKKAKEDFINAFGHTPPTYEF